MAKHTKVKFFINHHVAWWPSSSGDLRWPKNLGPSLAHGAAPEQLHTFQTPHHWIDWAKQPWLATYLGDAQIWLQTHKCQVCWTALVCKDPGPWPRRSIQKPCPGHRPTAPVPWRKFLKPEAKRRTLQLKNLNLCGRRSCISPLSQWRDPQVKIKKIGWFKFLWWFVVVVE